MRKSKTYILAVIVVLTVITACSTTSAIPDGEQLFTGLKQIEFTNYEKNDHAIMTQEEMEYALASAPNGALFGSSYYRNPFQIKLWIWNAFSQSNSDFAKWMTRAFGSKPKLMSEVNPELRSSVAQSQLKKYGYFNGKVSHEVITESNPKKAKVAYTVNMGRLWTMDSIKYINFPPVADSLIHAHISETLIHNGDPFSVPTLENERQRLSTLFRNNGYYYYKSGYASYLADTVNVPGKALVHLQMADSLDAQATHKWYIGKIDINFRRSFMEQLNDSLHKRHFTTYFNGSHQPLRTGVISRGLKLRPNQLYNSANEEESSKNILNMGLFSYSSLKFTPRDSSLTCDTLDLAVDLVFDKPYDFYVEANANGKTTGRMGPELVLGLTKRNAFRGGEKLDVNLHGSYEWQTGHQSEGSSSGINSYEYGGDVSLILPRLLTPQSLIRSWATRESNTGKPRHHRRHQYYQTPTTTIKASMNVLNRGSYFKRHVISGELTYDYWTSAQSHHSFSPLTLSYEYMQDETEAFKQLLNDNPYLSVSMRDQFVPKMSYTYTYTSPKTYQNPITWSTTLSEAGNVLAAGYALCGEKWGEKNKTMFKNPFAQFVKIETDFVKEWQISQHSSVLGHLNAGAVISYGNANQAPYYEQFYIGGANSVRAFNVRSIGPGKYYPKNSKLSYIEQTGDMKFLANLEYRPQLFGSLYGAVFLDAGNVWSLHNNDEREGAKFEAKNFLKQMALGTGVGLRYDMGLFVIRVDWGIGLHVPYETGKSGFYNISSFRDGQSIHLAVGYPF
ncbi:MAG: BamA/TamA family outer membrane protein [Prevotella sp.]|jgi:hypothetical protein|nr:BamA/TamA family outer membrane protein [Prevotella sp.]MCI1282555.1 BamA/TamA family outer membrane protein [Prevotella sp.]